MRARSLVMFVTMAVLLCVLASTTFVIAARKSMRLDGDVHRVEFSKSVPNDLNYQGYLVDATDTSAVTAVLAMTFRIYTAETMGSELWAETHPGVPVVNGLFNVLLGSVTPFPGGLFDGSPLWLQTEVGAEILTPRKPLVSVAYSHRAEMADHAVYADQADTLLLGSPSQDGALHLYRDGSADPTIRLLDYANEGGGIMLFEESGAYHSFFEPDVNGTGGFLWVGRNSSDGAFVVDGNAGATEEPIVTIGGSGQAAYFQMGQTGDASVMLPDNAVSAPEIMDEPGIAKAFQYSMSVANTGITNITSRSITAPGPGFIVARGYCYGGVGGTSIGNIVVGIDTSNTSLGSEAAVFGSNNEPLSAFYYRWGNLATEQTFEIASGGTYTYYLNATRGYTDGSATVWYGKLLLTYFPMNYGTVTVAATKGFEWSPTLLQSTSGSFAPGAEPKVRSITVEEHNARLEVEMAAMRAELDALKREVQNQKR